MLQALEKAIKHPIRLLRPRYGRLTDRLQRKCVDCKSPGNPLLSEMKPLSLSLSRVMKVALSTSSNSPHISQLCPNHRTAIVVALQPGIPQTRSSKIRRISSLGLPSLDLANPPFVEHTSNPDQGDEENRADQDSTNDDCFIAAGGGTGEELVGTLGAVSSGEGLDGRVHGCYRECVKRGMCAALEGC